MASAVIDVDVAILGSDPPKRVLCSHCEKILSPISQKNGKKFGSDKKITSQSSEQFISDETIIEVVEKLLPKEGKKGENFFVSFNVLMEWGPYFFVEGFTIPKVRSCWKYLESKLWYFVQLKTFFQRVYLFKVKPNKLVLSYIFNFQFLYFCR